MGGLRYLITFVCYGAHLHGDERTSVDRHHNGRELAMKREQMEQRAYSMDQERRGWLCWMGCGKGVCVGAGRYWRRM